MTVNKMKTSAIMTILIVLGALAFCEDVWDRIDLVFGPRVGFSYVTMDQAQYTSEVKKDPMFTKDSYSSFNSQFGISLEERILLGTTKSHFVFEEVALVGGIDQSVAIPSVSVMLGYRSDFGLEFGLGPMWSLSGLSVVYSVGWTFVFSDVYVPINISFIPDWTTGHHNIGLFTGFNFNIN
jgi:hypothetical protein